MRQELTALIGDWKAAGGGDRLPTTVEVRPKENRRSPEKNEKLRIVARR